MVKLKDLIRIMPNPTDFVLCIYDEHDNYNKHPKNMVYHRCVTSNFNDFWFRDNEDNDYTQERILELLEYEVLCINTYLYTGCMSNNEQWGLELNTGKQYPESDQEYDRLSHNFYVYIDKPLKARKTPR